jgi:hypothetical protein
MVIRIDKKDKDDIKLVNARPCQNCLDMMKTIGINRVYYSNDFGEIICEKIKDMISIHSSNVMIKFEVNTKSKSSNKLINKATYWDQLIQVKVPDIIKQQNFDYFVNYDLISLKNKYHIQTFKSGLDKQAHIVNSNNQIIKTILVI